MTAIFLAFLASFSLFSQKEGKEKKELHNNAETAFSHGDYSLAKKAYSELLKKIESKRDDWQNYVDIILRFAQVHLILHEYAEGEELLVALLKENPPPQFLPAITVLLGRLCSFQEKAGVGYAKMHEALTLISLEKWRPEERSFFHAVEYALNSYFENLMQKAKHFTATFSYKEAIDTYQEVLEGIVKGHFPAAMGSSFIKKKILFHLVECRFQALHYPLLPLSYDLISEEDKIDTKLFSLAALYYKERREYEKELLCLCTDSETNNSPTFFPYESALFEMGQFYFRNGNKGRAKEFLEKLVESKNRANRLVLMGALYLGKIYLLDQRESEAEALFLFVQNHLKIPDPLYFEATFLQAECLFQKKEYQKAALFFENALVPSSSKGDWTKSALYKLALSYIQLTDNESLNKAELILENLLLHNFEEAIVLSLADLYVRQNNSDKLQKLAERAQSHISESAQQALFLLKNSFEEKKTLVPMVTQQGRKRCSSSP